MEGKFPYSDNTRNARKFEYLGKFEAKIENTLDGYSGAQIGSFGLTSLKLKISCKCTFNVIQYMYSVYNTNRIEMVFFKFPRFLSVLKRSKDSIRRFATSHFITLACTILFFAQILAYVLDPCLRDRILGREDGYCRLEPRAGSSSSPLYCSVVNTGITFRTGNTLHFQRRNKCRKNNTRRKLSLTMFLQIWHLRSQFHNKHKQKIATCFGDSTHR